jgi:glutamate-1-semialdehyde 2,1-aminomutase
MSKAKGQYLYDADGNRYIDYCLSWGPMILGHAHKEVLARVKETMTKGTSFGCSTELEIELAQRITRAIKSVEKVRLVSSGTEAVMTAVRLARGVTGRDKIIKFVGCYHGHVDHLLVQAGSGALTLGAPSTPGVPKDFAKHTVLLPYNDSEAVKKAFARYSDKIAAVIVEPVAGNMGVVVPDKAFLQCLRTQCNKNKSLLIFDEVITGFRLGYGAIQKQLGIDADLTTLGKIIGGGFPIGACGGKTKYMDQLAPTGQVYQAGTLSGNPVCVAAGIATLDLLKSLNPYRELAKKTGELCCAISGKLTQQGIQHTINQTGSMFTVFFGIDRVTDSKSAMSADAQQHARYFNHMLKAGIYLPPSQFEACFLSIAHKQPDLNKTLRAVGTFR